jgi:hypothetical protein
LRTGGVRQPPKADPEDVVRKVSDAVFLRNARHWFLSWVMRLVKLKAEDLGQLEIDHA